MSPTRKPSATHGMPSPGFTLTPCCGIPPTDLPSHHVVTPDLRAVTCPGPRTSPVRELIGIVLTGTQLLGTRRRGFLPHGDEDGHVYDERCALCAGDVNRLADALTAALVAAFPDADVRNLRPTPPPDGRPPAAQGGPLRTLLAVILATAPAADAWTETSVPAHGSPDGHDYDGRCALCHGDADVLALAVEAALIRALPSVIPRPPRARRTAAPVTEGAA